MNREEVVMKIVESGITADKAEKKVKQIEDKIKVQLKNQDDKAIEVAINLAYSQILNSLSQEKVRGIVIGIGEKKDANDYAKRVALNAYKENAQRAISEGLVRVDEDETVVPLDTKEFFDEGKTKKNGNFGKPLATRMQREIVVAIENDIIRAFADVDVTLGDEYDIYGKVKKPYMSVSKNPKPRFIRTPNGTERWNTVYNSVGASQYAMSFNEMIDAKNNTFVITKAFVKGMGESDYGMWVTLESDETTESVICNVAPDIVEFVNANVEVGYEVIVVGSFSRFIGKDDAERKSVRVTGIIPNPSSALIADTLGDIADILYADE